jgi:hypothetical protein
MFEYGCFISYVHAREELMREFMASLVPALKGELEPLVRNGVYLDNDRLATGTKHEHALGRVLCASACWVLIYVPQYLEHDYCMREFRAMQILEERRRRALGHRLPREKGMILPIVLRGDKAELPEQITSSMYLEFTQYTVASPKINVNESSMNEIRELASYVKEIFKLGAHLSEDCSEFDLPPAGGGLSFDPAPPKFPGP